MLLEGAPQQYWEVPLEGAGPCENPVPAADGSLYQVRAGRASDWVLAVTAGSSSGQVCCTHRLCGVLSVHTRMRGEGLGRQGVSE